MKNFIFYCLLSVGLLGQSVDPTYPVAVPFPTTGTIPNTLPLSAPASPGLSFVDNRGVTLARWVVGSPIIVGDITERGQIKSAVLMQGSLCYVVSTGHFYQLQFNRTTWNDLGDPSTWGSGGSGGNVNAIDTLTLIGSASAPVVITKGYSVVGDGGQAAYRYVSGDSTATNTVTVFAGTAGRYFLMQSGAISAKQAGVVGDGIANDHDALQALFNACPNMTARIEPLSYLSTGGLIIPANTRVIAHGATITVNTVGDDRAVDMLSNSQLTGGTVFDHRVSGGLSSECHCAIRIGSYGGASVVTNVIVRGVTFSTDWDNDLSGGLFITGGANNITIDHCTVPASTTLRTAFLLHWGFVDPAASDPALGTLHPSNILLTDNTVGALTATTGDVTPIYVSACYNVKVLNHRNVRARFGLEYVCGDYGFTYSGLQGQQLGGVVFENVTCEQAYLTGAYFQGKDNNSVIWPLNGSVNNCTLIGSNNGGGNGGLYFNSVVGLTLNNNIISGHEYGTIFTNGCSSITFNSGLFYTNRLAGFIASDPNTKDVTVTGVRFANNCRAISGNSAAGIQLVAGANFRINNNTLGNAVSEPNQEVGVSISTAFVNASLQGNYVADTSGGVNLGYYVQAPASLSWFADNTAASGITVSGELAAGAQKFINFRSAVNAQTGTTYTVLAADNGKVVTASNGSAITITVNTNLPDGGSVNILQLGAGQVTISPSGLTIRNRAGFTKTAGQYSAITLIRIGTDLWLTGDGI